VLLRAREIADRKEAVQGGSNYFEDQHGRAIPRDAITDSGDVCGVCIAGAVILAEIELDVCGVFGDGVFGDGVFAAVRAIEPVAAEVSGLDEYAAITDAVESGGIKYVREVLDRMIERERVATRGVQP